MLRPGWPAGSKLSQLGEHNWQGVLLKQEDNQHSGMRRTWALDGRTVGEPANQMVAAVEEVVFLAVSLTLAYVRKLSSLLAGLPPSRSIKSMWHQDQCVIGSNAIRRKNRQCACAWNPQARPQACTHRLGWPVGSIPLELGDGVGTGYSSSEETVGAVANAGPRHCRLEQWVSLTFKW